MRTRDSVPLDRAMSMENLALAGEALADKTAGPARRAHLAAARAHVAAALEIFTPRGTPFNPEKATRLRDALAERWRAEGCAAD